MYKYLSENDTSIVDYKLYRYNNYSSSNASVFGIKILTGSLVDYDVTFTSSSDRNSDGTYKRLVYDTIRQLYYATGSVIPSIDPESIQYIQKEMHNEIRVISIPHLVFGEKIKPKSVKFTGYSGSDSYTIVDDGHYNLYDTADSASFATGSLPQVGNIFYESGMMILTSTGSYAGSDTGSYLDTSTNFVLEFSGSNTIYEFETICNIEESEFNYTNNVTAFLNQSGSEYDPIFTHSGSFIGTASFGGGPVTMSYADLDFRPYITGIGLYNDDDELVAVAKFPRPVKKENYLDQAFILKFDL